MFTLSQLSASPQWTFALGAFVIITLFLLGGGLMGVKLWKELKGDAEPKHSPGVDVKIRNEVSASERRTGAIIGEVKAELREDQRQHRDEVKKDLNQAHGRISGLRDEVKTDLHDTRNALADGIKEILKVSSDMRESVAAVKAHTDNQERQLARLDQKLEASKNRQS